jgi:uncharacterized membrane-anchored protein YitT (DUF2179 family)
LKIDSIELLKAKELGRTLSAILGTFLYAVGLNLFIIPVGLFSGGIMGTSQIIRTLLVDYLHLPIYNFDIAGIIYFIINIPLFFIAYRTIGKLFFIKTMICMISMTTFLTLIPIPTHLILTDDIITSCLIGGIIGGVGSGLSLMMGGSGGGMDIVGLYFIKRKGNVSIGKISLAVNFFVYGICFFLFDVTIAIYSIIFAAVSSVAMDKVHSQNINVEVIVITRKDLSAFQTDVMNQMGRGITKWNTTGAYTKEGSEILYIVLSKYEVNHLKRLVHKYDSNAFIVVKEGVWVDGNYTKKL